MRKEKTTKKPYKNPDKVVVGLAASELRKENQAASGIQKIIPAARLEFIFALIIALSGFFLYLNTIFNEYAVDDLAVIRENRFTKQGIAGIPVLLRTFYWEGYWNNNSGIYRPLSMVTFAIEWEFFPDNPHAGHLTNILLYTLTGFLLFKVLRRLMSGYDILLPFFISLLFIAHPVHTEAVANIKSRDEILCLLFFLLAMDNLLRFSDSGKKWWLLMAVMSYFLCLLAKESAVSFLLIFPLLLLFFRDIRPKKIFVQILPFVAAVAVYFIIRIIILGVHTAGKEYTYLDNALVAAPDLMSRLATAFVMLGKYLKLLVFPHPLSYDYSFLEVPFVDWTSYRAIVPLLIYISAFTFAVRSLLARDKNIFAFGILFYLLSIAVVANVFLLIGCTMADRFLYIPSLGFCMIMVYALFRIFPAKNSHQKKSGIGQSLLNYRWVSLITLAIFVSWSIKTVARNRDWKNNITLFISDAAASPGSARVRTNSGSAILKSYDKDGPDKEKQAGILNKAIGEFEAAIKIDPDDKMAYLDLGSASYMKMEYPRAIENLRTAIRLNPGDPKAYSALGNSYYRMHDFDNAILNLTKCIDLNFSSSETYNFLGGSYFGKGDYPNAVKAYLKAIDLEPKNTELCTNLGSVYGSMGDYLKAIEYFRRANTLSPGNSQILGLISMTFQNLGNHDSAEFYHIMASKIQQK
jgi:Flp pilus assembly protein TadD